MNELTNNQDSNKLNSNRWIMIRNLNYDRENSTLVRDLRNRPSPYPLAGNKQRKMRSTEVTCNTTINDLGSDSPKIKSKEATNLLEKSTGSSSRNPAGSSSRNLAGNSLGNPTGKFTSDWSSNNSTTTRHTQRNTLT
ncbi:hypothetical protein YC2023_058536 [Brassica napus]